MYDFTQSNYLYQSYTDDLILKSALRDCKTEEEKDEVIKAHQQASLLTILISFGLAVVCCGLISLFT